MDSFAAREWKQEWTRKRGTSQIINKSRSSLSLFPSTHNQTVLMDHLKPRKVNMLDELEAAAAAGPTTQAALTLPNAIPPTLHTLQSSAPIITAPPPLSLGNPEPTPFSACHMTRQTTAMFSAATRTRSSTDELIDPLTSGIKVVILMFLLDQ